MIPCQRHLFDLPDEVAYLNCAYMSPLLTAAAAAGEAAMARKLRPWTIRPEHFFTESEQARSLFARLVGAGPDDVAIIPSASYGTAVAAANLPLARGARVVLLEDQFPSNVYVWRELAARTGGRVDTIPRPKDGTWTEALEASLDQDVAITALPHCHWTDGGLIDLVRISSRCREVESALVLDVTQSLGALPLDLAAVDPDFLICPGYKWLLGPYSLGYLYVARRHQDGIPLEHNWITRAGSEDFARLVDYQDGFQAGARRFDMGERSNFALLSMSAVALQQLLDWGVEAIATTLAARTRAVAARAAALGLTALPPDHRAGHFLGLGFPEGMPPGLPERLAEERVHVSLRGASLRVTPHLYTTDDDVDRLVAVLAAAL